VPDDIFRHVVPEDLLAFGLIQEFVGRLPVFTSVSKLDREALVAVLTEPKNALVKQYPEAAVDGQCGTGREQGRAQRAGQGSGRTRHWRARLRSVSNA